MFRVTGYGLQGAGYKGRATRNPQRITVVFDTKRSYFFNFTLNN